MVRFGFSLSEVVSACSGKALKSEVNGFGYTFNTGGFVGAIIVFILIPIVCAGICYSIAKKRNAAIPFWVAMGALFGPLALPFVLMSKPKK